MYAFQVELKQKFDTEDVPKFFGFIEKEIQSYGKDGYAVASSVSLFLTCFSHYENTPIQIY